MPDNKFRSRDPKFADQKKKHGKRHQEDKRKRANRFSPDDFDYDPIKKTCICPGGHSIKLRSERKNELGHDKINFVGYRKICKECDLKNRCMKTPSSADHYDGCGRQVSFIVEKNKRKANYTDWMKHRVDSPKGKQIYSHRMSVVEPVFGNMGTNKKLNRFSLKGKRKVQGQWQLYCMIHNIEKLKNYGQIAA